MKRPKKDDYRGHLENNCWVSKHTEYVTDLEKYCDELEKALDKACEELNNGWSGKYWGNEKTFWSKEQWKEWCMGND